MRDTEPFDAHVESDRSRRLYQAETLVRHVEMYTVRS